MVKISIKANDLEGIFLFKADSGMTLYSKTKTKIQEDMFSAHLGALKGFFTTLNMGGLSSFSSDNYMIYLTSANNVLTALIVKIENKSNFYFKLGHEICILFYNEFKSVVNDKRSFFIPHKEKFDVILEDILNKSDKKPLFLNQYLQLYQINETGDIEGFDFKGEEHLTNLSLFIVLNELVKKIFIIENINKKIPPRVLYLAGKAATQLNLELKSEYTINNISDPMDADRIISQICKLIQNESFPI